MELTGTGRWDAGRLKKKEEKKTSYRVTRYRKSTDLALLKQKQTARNQSIKHVRRSRAHTVPHTLVWKHIHQGGAVKKTVKQPSCTCIINVYQPAVLKYE